MRTGQLEINGPYLPSIASFSSVLYSNDIFEFRPLSRRFLYRVKSARSDIEAIFGLNSLSVFEEESF